MEVSEKDHARAAWKASRRHAPRRGRGASSAPRQTEELQSNDFRYAEEDDEQELPEQEPGTQPRRSQGADLAALLQENLQWDRSLMSRSRRQLDLEAEEALPPGALQAAEQALAVDYEALAASLSTLPLHTLLGVEPELFGEAAEPAAEPQASGGGRHAEAASAGAAAEPEPAAAAVPAVAIPASRAAPAEPQRREPPAAAPPQAAASASARASQQPAGGGADDELDALLDMARTAGPAAAPAPRTEVGRAPATGQDSLEDWLDSL